LYKIHVLLTDFELTNPNLIQNDSTDQMVIRYIKNLVNELVKLRNEAIKLDYLKGVDRPDVKDKYMKKWIINILASMEHSDGKKTERNTLTQSVSMTQSFVSESTPSNNIENLIAYKNKLQQSNVSHI
jgi:hypothetical protein